MAFDAGAVKGRAEFDDSKWEKGVKGLKSSNKGMAKSMFAAQVAFQVFQKAVDVSTKFVKDAIQNSISFTETQNKFNTVFGDGNAVIKEASDAYKNLTDNYGMSDKAALEMLASTGDLLTGLGFTKAEAIGLSSQVQELSADLASFQNISAEVASERLTKALLGETESAKSLGIVIRQNTKEFRDQVKQLVETQGMTKLQAKAQLILEQAYAQSKNAVGDYAKTSMSLANMQRLVKSETENVSVRLGSLFLPIMKDITETTLGATRALAEFLEEEENLEQFQNIIDNIGAGFAVFGAVLKKVGKDAFKEVQKPSNNLKISLDKLFDSLSPNISAFEIIGGTMKLFSIGLALVILYLKQSINYFVDLLNVVVATTKAMGIFHLAMLGKNSWERVGQAMLSIGDAYKQMKKNGQEYSKEMKKVLVDGFKDFPNAAAENTALVEKVMNDHLARAKAEREKQRKDQLNAEKNKAKEIVEITTETAGEIAQAEAEAQAERKSILDEWDSVYKKSIEENIADIERRRDAFIAAGVAEVEATEWAQNEIANLEQENLDKRKSILDEWDSVQEKSVDDNIADIERRRDAFIAAGVDEVEATEWANKEIQKLWADKAGEILGIVETFVSEIADFYTDMFDVIMQHYEQEYAALVAKNDEEMLELIEDKETTMEEFDEETEINLARINKEETEALRLVDEAEAAGLITQAEAAAQRKAIEDKAEEERQERMDARIELEKELDDAIADLDDENRAEEQAKEKEMFEANKANMIAMIWVQSAIGVVGAWAQSIAQLGPIAGAIMAAALTVTILALAVAQTAVVANETFTPGLQEGGMASGRTRVNEAGGEIITLPDGSQVIPNDISKQIAGDSGGNNVIVNVSFRGAQISNEMTLKKITKYVSGELGRQLEMAL